MNKLALSLTAMLLLPAALMAQPCCDGSGVPEGTRFKTVRTMLGAGTQNVLDTYLSPLTYKGPDLRLVREITRTARRNSFVVLDNTWDIDLAYPANAAGYRSVAALLNWNYAVRYRLLQRNGWKVEAGGATDMEVGGLYNLHNGNNPASARAAMSLNASFKAAYSFRLGQHDVSVDYKLDVPLLGAAFSPAYGQSYYEMFMLGHNDGMVSFVSLHNRPSMTNRITADIGFRFLTLSFGYMWDVNQTHMNNIKTHYYTHSFLIGFRKNIWTR